MLAAGVGELVGATAFLTRVPVARGGAGSGAGAFALVGGAIGLVAAVPAALLLDISPLLAAGVAVALLVLLDGALHLDGVADSADALAAPTPEARERARRDSAVGAAGAVALVLVLLLQTAALAAVPEAAFVASVAVAGAASRSVPVLFARLGRGARSGLASWWASAVRPRDGVACLLVAAAWLLLPGARPLGLLVGLLLGGVVLLLLSRTIGASGDAFGASIELGFLGALIGSAW